MKDYTKPVIKSAPILEWTALACDDYIFYTKDYDACMEELVGIGKEAMTACTELRS